MPKYSLPITRKWIDVYIVEAKSPTDAGIQVGQLIAQGSEPDHQTEVGYNVGSAKLVIVDEPTLPGIGQNINDADGQAPTS